MREAGKACGTSAGTCAFMLYHSVNYARGLTMLGAAPVAVGMGLYALSRKLRDAR